MSQQVEQKMIDPAQQQQVIINSTPYRSPEVQEIDQLMTVIDYNQNNEMTQEDYKENPFYINPALVK